MTLYLMRHGIAEDALLLQSDADRKLTEKGTLRTAMVAKAMKAFAPSIDRIISSPYIRAMETAEIIARILGLEPNILSDRRLTPGGSYQGFSELLKENDDAENILITGHEPSMGDFISGICADGKLMIDVKKASITAIEIYRLRPHAVGVLHWSLPPRIIEAMMTL